MDLECHTCKQLTPVSEVQHLFVNWSFITYMSNYQFQCSACGGGLPNVRRCPAVWDGILLTTVANLTAAQRSEDEPKQFFDLNQDIIPFILTNWDSICTNRSRSSHWSARLDMRFKQYPDIYDIDDSTPPQYSLTEKYQDLSVLTPSFVDNLFKIERKVVDPTPKPLPPQATVKLPGTRGPKRKGETFPTASKRTRTTTPKLPVHGYPTEHPHNKDGYRYILAEVDPRTTEKDLDAYAGKAVPGFLYRVVAPPLSLLALHDRAPQLKVSEDRLNVTGDKGYCMIRGTVGVSHGQWYFEVRVDSMPEPSACRIGWAQSLGQLQAPCGYDKFSYSWRSRKGTFFHQSVGKHYSAGGFGTGDVLGFLIDLPDNADSSKHLPPTHKDKALIRFKNFLYYEEKDYVEREEKALMKLPSSRLVCFKNGVSQGVACEGVYEGRYYPAVSLFKNATITCNFGPTFECPPDDDTQYRPMSEAADHNMIEQAMADMLFHVEKDVDGEAEILKRAEEENGTTTKLPAAGKR
ncbi:set1/Ash2 histone methyltransferase complex subunit ASH2-like [Sycon ciliatum]|uniref:set1/Ash2 histone methyltransferase complex subunit ASH2-like n=1 Tax=Sycon ciliatum TaxID=27933 RepID=UPI0031F6E083